MAMFSGGRHVYKKFEVNAEGSRIARRVLRADSPDLQSTYIYNFDGSEVLRYIRLDLDAHKTLSEWKDETGAISWKKIAQYLRENYPNILRQIEYVTVSRSKKGLHILIGLSPLPLSEKTRRAQYLARKIQTNLIDIFNELGIGADAGGKGLKQDFSTFRKQENVIHHNRLLTQKIENSAKKRPYLDDDGIEIFLYQNINFLNQLSKACDDAMEKLGIKNGYRLYRHLGLESKIAKLYLFTLGMYELNDQELNRNHNRSGPILDESLPSQTEENNIDDTFEIETPVSRTLKLEVISPRASYAKINSVELSLDEIAQIMDTEKRNIYKQFWLKEEIQALFHVEKMLDGNIRITVRDTKSIFKRIQRALAILNYVPTSIDFRLLPPELVEDGLRNSSIVSWALALKWNGVSQELALLKISSLVKEIPEYKHSSTCKKSQLRAIVASVYRNMRQMWGIKSLETLPDWLDVSNVISLNKKASESTTISSRRSILGPCATSRKDFGINPIRDLDLFSQGLPDDQKIVSTDNSTSSQNSSTSGDCSKTPALGVVGQIKAPEIIFDVIYIQKIRVVSYKNRIGFFLNNVLLICVIKNRHYKLSKALEYIESKILCGKIKFDLLKDVIHMRRNANGYDDFAKQLYAEGVAFVYAQNICGYKNRFYENMDEYDSKKAKKEGISLDKYRERFIPLELYKPKYSIYELEQINDILF